MLTSIRGLVAATLFVGAAFAATPAFADEAAAVQDNQAIDQRRARGLSSQRAIRVRRGGYQSMLDREATPDDLAALRDFVATRTGVEFYVNWKKLEGEGISKDSAITISLKKVRVDMLLGPAASPELRAEVVSTMAAIDPEAYRAGAAAVLLLHKEWASSKGVMRVRHE